MRLPAALSLPLLLIGCAAPVGAGSGPAPSLASSATPPAFSFTAVPTLTLAPALPSGALWLARDSFNDSIWLLRPGVELEAQALPLPADHWAGELVASADGSALIYRVVAPDGVTAGFGYWSLRTGQLSLLPLPEESTAYTQPDLANDGSVMLFSWSVAVAEGSLWQIDTCTIEGYCTLLFDWASVPGPPQRGEAFAWQPPGPVLATYELQRGGLLRSGLYAFDPLGEEGRVLVEIDGMLRDARLSPDGARVLLLAGSPGDGAALAAVFDLRSGALLPIEPPRGYQVFSARWLDADRLLLDLTGAGREQSWALAAIGGEPELLDLGPDRDYLYDYAPYGAGLAYTVIRADGSWRLYLLSSLDESASIEPVDLTPMQGDAFDGPRIVHAGK